VKVQATQDITLASLDDIEITATSRPASRIVYASGVILDHATNDITYSGAEVELNAVDSTYFQATTDSLTLQSQENIVFDTKESIRFLVQSNVSVSTTFDQLIESVENYYSETNNKQFKRIL
jgi:hypothetical protein